MLTSKNSDAHWRKIGETDPYFGVLDHPKYHLDNLTDDVRAEFFASGVYHIKHISQIIREHIVPQFQPARVLDFGCGVGRLVIPFSEWATEVTGVDVSEAMLNEARQNCNSRNISNVTFVKSDDHLSLLSGKFDLIHSTIVLQHIPTSRGMALIQRLLSFLDDQGVIVLQFPYKVKSSTRIANKLFQTIPFLGNTYNLLKGQSFSTPIMQANSYNINSLIHMLQFSGLTSCFIESNTNEYFENAILYSQRHS